MPGAFKFHGILPSLDDNGIMSKKSQRNDYDPRVYHGICHRGLHGDGVTENGLLAFRKAIESDMAFELDVHLTKDGKLVVCHDDNLKRTTGKEGVIEDLTLEEIAQYTLLDGEKVPLFQEVLELNQERVPMVVELKVHKGNYKPLRKAVMETLEPIKNPKSIVLISFDPRALLGIGRRFQRQLLVVQEHDWTWKLRGLYDAVDLDSRMVKRDSVIRYRKKGGIVNVWTIETLDQLNGVKDYADMVTLQFIKPEEDKEAMKDKQINP